MNTESAKVLLLAFQPRSRYRSNDSRGLSEPSPKCVFFPLVLHNHQHHHHHLVSGGNVHTHLWELTVWLSHDVVTCQLPSCFCFFVFFYWEHDEGPDSGGCRATQTSCKTFPSPSVGGAPTRSAPAGQECEVGFSVGLLPVDSELMRNLKCT